MSDPWELKWFNLQDTGLTEKSSFENDNKISLELIRIIHDTNAHNFSIYSKPINKFNRAISSRETAR